MSSSSRRKIQMPAAARTGLALLIVGAIFVGVGSYTHRGGFSLYGLPMVMVGFSLYLVSSIINARKRQTAKK
ncbi:MAG TPA: hypothetical protein VK553_04025 [Candidatus Nitrosopolaris rasttigaisensis]|nr:hypothetical protein [Candidatus Nitrosopolaris rasttigaisensis]